MPETEYAKLYTQEGLALSESDSVPWDIYPRPQLRRDSFFCLNGFWDFTVTPSSEHPASYDHTIRVPFAPESLLSGIHQRFSEDSFLWYRRTFSLPADFLPDGFRLLLHFGAVDQCAVVWVNGQKVGEHTGGYDAFSFDIYLEEEVLTF